MAGINDSKGCGDTSDKNIASLSASTPRPKKPPDPGNPPRKIGHPSRKIKNPSRMTEKASYLMEDVGKLLGSKTILNNLGNLLASKNIATTDKDIYGPWQVVNKTRNGARRPGKVQDTSKQNYDNENDTNVNVMQTETSSEVNKEASDERRNSHSIYNPFVGELHNRGKGNKPVADKDIVFNYGNAILVHLQVDIEKNVEQLHKRLTNTFAVAVSRIKESTQGNIITRVPNARDIKGESIRNYRQEEEVGRQECRGSTSGEYNGKQ
ncbi:hypothetical protein Cni_G19373 [Canna indica]|uniref:Uncharacterized protein n=1 Tax=Canna indica TaxID=4628 RepID=A0AAQ3KL18_9LILI|nr:hypothetical protein Cni_G19373 [Canna indica]